MARIEPAQPISQGTELIRVRVSGRRSVSVQRCEIRFRLFLDFFLFFASSFFFSSLSLSPPLLHFFTLIVHTPWPSSTNASSSTSSAGKGTRYTYPLFPFFSSSSLTSASHSLKCQPDKDSKSGLSQRTQTYRVDFRDRITEQGEKEEERSECQDYRKGSYLCAN